MKSLPNILSSLRIILAPIFLYLYLQGGLIWGGLSILIFTIAAITDYFDGHYARKYQVESTLGVFLDPLADKVLTFSAFIVLPFIDPSQFPWWAVILIIIRDVFMTGLRVYANKKDMQMKTRSFAKTKTTIQLTFLYIALFLGVFEGTGNILADWSELILSTGVMFWLMMFVTFITVYSGIEYVFTNKKVISQLGIFMRSLKLFIGSGFGSGLIPFAPGTWGSLLSLVPIYFLMMSGNIFLVPLFVLITSLLSLWVTSACVEQWGEDPGKLVMDEWAGQALTFISISSTGVLDSDLMILGIGFILFRIFDILKPLGINKLQKYDGGAGILLDDLLAGLYALICLKSLIFFWS